MKIVVAQIDSASLLAFVQNASSGAFSGNLSSYLSLSGTLGSYVAYLGQDQAFVGANTFAISPTVNFTGSTGSALQRGYALQLITGSIVAASGALAGQFVPLAGNATILGYNTFSGALGVGVPVNTGDAVNFLFLRNVSGVLQSGIGNATVPNAVTVTGNEQIGGTKSFTGSPSVPFATTLSGAVNLSGLSGSSGSLLSYANVVSGILQTGINTLSGVLAAAGTSFWFDPVISGLNLVEYYVPKGFFVTGVSFGCRTTGAGPTGGGIMTGRLYQVDFNNTEQTLLSFTFTSGTTFSGSPLLSTYVSGRNRVGVSFTNILSGMGKFSIGVFGGTYS